MMEMIVMITNFVECRSLFYGWQLSVCGGMCWIWCFAQRFDLLYYGRRQLVKFIGLGWSIRVIGAWEKESRK
jgi:hypothetical protein